MNNSEIFSLVMVCLLGVVIIAILILHYYEKNKEKKKFKKDVEELKIGNRYKMKKFRWINDNPFKVEPTYIVEITDIKLNYKDKWYVQYKQIEPEYIDKPFSESFSEFIDCFDLIKH